MLLLLLIVVPTLAFVFLVVGEHDALLDVDPEFFAGSPSCQGGKTLVGLVAFPFFAITSLCELLTYRG